LLSVSHRFRVPKPFGEIPKPENISPLVKILLVADSRFLSDQYIDIDGGTEIVWRGNDSPQTWNMSMDDFRRL
jgi:hypothetical protein